MGEVSVSLPPVSTMLDSQHHKWGCLDGNMDSSYFFQDHSLYLEIAPLSREVDYYKNTDEGQLLDPRRGDSASPDPPVYTNLDESTRECSMLNRDSGVKAEHCSSVRPKDSDQNGREVGG